MPYAIEGEVTRRQTDNGVPISEEKYNEAREHALSGGMIKVHGGKMILTRKPEKKEDCEYPVWQDGDWHHEPLPEKTQAEKDAERVSEIDTRLRQIDVESDRPLRAIEVARSRGQEPNQYDIDRLIALEDEAEVLRDERKTLT